MSESARSPKVTAQADIILTRVGILKNPYFTSLRDGSMTLECFRKTQEQFFFAVTFYSRPMAALIAHIPDPKDRLDILHNLVEEHGEFQEAGFHSNTFRKFLTRIGARGETIEEVTVGPEVRAFNSVLVTSCLYDEIEVGIGCMGIIEYAFSDVSALIGNVVVERGWIDKAKLVHYSLHAELDNRHAEDLFAVVERKREDEKRRYFILQGLDLGAYIFDRLYRDLYSTAIAGS